MILHIAARELRSLFYSPLAWTVLAVVEFILAFLFLGQIDFYIQIQPDLAMMEAPPGITELIVSNLFSSSTIVMLLVVPLISMRLISEERKSGTLPLLLSAPLSMSDIILGKYLGILGFMGIMLGLLLLMPLSLLLVGDLDWGLLMAGLLGLALLLAAFSAAGLFMSTLTSQPAVAAIASFGLLLLLWIIDWAVQDSTTSVLSYLSLNRHYESLIRGLFQSSDVVYYLLFIILFLGLSIRRLDNERLQD